MHAESERRRGYNQSRVLASAFATLTDLPLLPEGTLVKSRQTLHQVDQDVTTRWENVRDSFSVPAASLAGLRLVIVDDVCTTGATLHNCAEALLGAGAIEAACLVLARTDLWKRASHPQ